MLTAIATLRLGSLGHEPGVGGAALFGDIEPLLSSRHGGRQHGMHLGYLLCSVASFSW